MLLINFKRNILPKTPINRSLIQKLYHHVYTQNLRTTFKTEMQFPIHSPSSLSSVQYGRTSMTLVSVQPTSSCRRTLKFTTHPLASLRTRVSFLWTSCGVAVPLPLLFSCSSAAVSRRLRIATPRVGDFQECRVNCSDELALRKLDGLWRRCCAATATAPSAAPTVSWPNTEWLLVCPPFDDARWLWFLLCRDGIYGGPIAPRNPYSPSMGHTSDSGLEAVHDVNLKKKNTKTEQ